MRDGCEISSDELWALVSGDALDRLTGLALRVLHAPASAISFFLPDYQHIKSGSGLSGTPFESRLIASSGSICHSVFESGQPLVVNSIELDDRFKDGTVKAKRPIEAYLGVPVLNGLGQTIGTFCVIDERPHAWTANDLATLTDLATFAAAQVELQREIIDRNHAAALLLESEARRDALASHIPVVFERRKTGPAQSRYTLFRTPQRELAGTYGLTDVDADPLRFIHAEDRERVKAAIQDATIAETDLSLTFRVLFPSEQGTRWMRSEAVMRRDGDGVAIWDGLCFDITDLVAAHDAADSARLATESLWVDVNHELRTPLQAIMGYTDLLNTETRPEMVRAHVHSIESASAGLLSIVNRLLDLARGENVAMAPLDMAPTDIRSLAEACHDLVAPLALGKRLDTRVAVDANIPETLNADGPKIRQVLVNLLDNAIKYTETGSVVLYVSFHETRLRFSVADTGIGVPAQKTDLLFHRFSRIDPERRSLRGTGLGLAIAKQLVESMGGTIGVIPNPDRGSTFWFEVRAEAATMVDDATDPSPQKAVEPLSLSRNIRILIADDLDLNRQLISDMLSLEGYEIDCVSDGMEAVQAVKDRPYNLILMDMIMPGMDGLAATRAIRSLPAPACDVTIVALTAHSFKEQLDSCIAAGMDATITKPMSLDALISTVRSWTQGRSRAA